MHNLSSKKMIDLFEEEYPRILRCTEEKSEYSRLHEAFYSGLLYFQVKLLWHDVNVVPMPKDKVVWVRVSSLEERPSILYGCSTDSFKNAFPDGYKITHWQEILPFETDGDMKQFHIDE